MTPCTCLWLQRVPCRLAVVAAIFTASCVWAAPASTQPVRPPPAWRNDPEIAFTYYLNSKNAAAARASFGFYHIRRTVPNDQWVTLVLPLADFICSYGQGTMAPTFQKQASLAGDQVLALMFLSYFGQRTELLRLLIDEVTFVKVPGTPQVLRSFHQSQTP